MKFGLLQYSIIILSIATALIHIALAIPNNLIMFYLNGFGYILLVMMLYLSRLRNHQTEVRFIFIAYTAVTIFGWAILGERTVVAYLDKIIELSLLILLWMEHLQMNA